MNRNAIMVMLAVEGLAKYLPTFDARVEGLLSSKAPLLCLFDSFGVERITEPQRLLLSSVPLIGKHILSFTKL
jgi:hypothetical protein